jgi:CRP/FNR family cyclic AMP-dependent transcriptional regulator
MDLLEVFKDSEDVKNFSAGTVIINEGASGDHMYVVMVGEVDVSINDQIIATASPGEILGEMALIDSDTRSAALSAKTDCQLALIDQSSFDSLIRYVPDFSKYVMKVLADRLKTAYRVISN